MSNSTDYEITIKRWLRDDSQSYALLLTAEEFAQKHNLGDWCIAAGFVRNLVWDKLHQHPHSTALNDIDLIYFGSFDLEETRDRYLQQLLRENNTVQWSLKNQARMHIRNGDTAYKSTADAMSHWPEIETAIGARLVDGEIQIVAPLGCDALFNNTITANPVKRDITDFNNRVLQKQWLAIWPQLRVVRSQ